MRINKDDTVIAGAQLKWIASLPEHIRELYDKDAMRERQESRLSGILNPRLRAFSK